MGLTFLQVSATETTAQPALSVSKAYASNTTNGSLMFAHCLAVAASGTITVTDTLGNTWNQLGAGYPAGGGQAFIFWAVNTGSGANTVTLHSTTSVNLWIILAEYSGQAAGNPFDTTVPMYFWQETGTATVNFGSVNTSFTNETVIFFSRVWNGVNTIIPQDGSTVRSAANSVIFLQDRNTTIAGSYASAFSCANGNAQGTGIFIAVKTPASLPAGSPVLIQGNTGFSTTPSLGFVKSVTKGDLIIMLWGCAFGGGTPQDLGFQDSLGSVYHDMGLINSDLGNNPSFAMGWAIAAATGACTISSKNTSPNNGYTMCVAEFAGVTQIENYTVGSNSGQVSPSFFTGSSITPSAASSLAIALTTVRQGVAVGAFTGTWTSGYATAAQLGNGGGTGICVDIGYKILTAAAATAGTETVTNAGVSGQNNGRITMMDFIVGARFRTLMGVGC